MTTIFVSRLWKEGGREEGGERSGTMVYGCWLLRVERRIKGREEDTEGDDSGCWRLIQERKRG